MKRDWIRDKRSSRQICIDEKSDFVGAPKLVKFNDFSSNIDDNKERITRHMRDADREFLSEIFGKRSHSAPLSASITIELIINDCYIN